MVGSDVATPLEDPAGTGKARTQQEPCKCLVVSLALPLAGAVASVHSMHLKGSQQAVLHLAGTEGASMPSPTHCLQNPRLESLDLPLHVGLKVVLVDVVICVVLQIKGHM